MKKIIRKRFVGIGIALFIVLNIALTTRWLSEVWKVEEHCMKYAAKLSHKESNKDWQYWNEKIPQEQYNEHEKRLAQKADTYITRSTRAMFTCEDERNSQVKYFIFF